MPDWNVDDVPEAAWEPGSGYGDGAGVANDFLERAREMGVVYRSQTRVTGFRVEGGRVTGVDDRTAGDSRRRPSSRPTGPWSRPLFAGVGFDLPVEGEYHEVAILKNPPGLREPAPACIDGITTTYFRSEVGGPDARGRFLGPARSGSRRFPQSASTDSLATLVERVTGRVPALADAEIWRGVTGVYDV